MADVPEDRKPVLFGPALQYATQSSLSSVSATQTKRHRHLPSTAVHPVLSALAANVEASRLTTTTRVQKVRPQSYSCKAGSQADSGTETGVIAVAAAPSSSKCYTSQCSDRIRSVLSGCRNVSVVKPAASRDVQVAVPASQTVAQLPGHQKTSPRYSTALFDTSRTVRGLPLAQVYPSRVVTSAVQNGTTETVPSPVRCGEEQPKKSPSNSTPLLDRNCPVVGDSSSSSAGKTSSSASPPSLISRGSDGTVKFPVPVSTSSTNASPVPILSQNAPSSCSTNVLPLPTVSPAEMWAMKSASSNDVLPPVETSPTLLSDRESVPDEDDSGHELSSSLLEWDDNLPDGKDSVSDACHTELLPVKRPAFEVIADCNRTLLSDISHPCNAAVAFERSLLRRECGHRDFITRTKYYRFFSRKTSAAGSGPHELDVVQPEKCDLISVPHSQEQRLSAFPSAGNNAVVKDADSNPNKNCSFSKEPNCRYGLIHKKANKLLCQQQPRNGSVSYNVIGSIYSPMPNNRLKRGNNIVRSSSPVDVKSELVEDSASLERKPDRLSRTVCQRRMKVVSAAYKSSDELVGSIYEMSSTVSDCGRDSCAIVKTPDVKNPPGSALAKQSVYDFVDDCSKVESKAHSDQTKVSASCNKLHCKKELLTESASVSGSGRKNPHSKVSGIGQRKSGDANNNQGKIHNLVSSSSATSVGRSEHLKVGTITAETEPVDSSRQSLKMTINTRSSTISRKCDVTASNSHCRMTSGVPKTQQLGKRFGPLLQCSKRQSVAKADLTAKGSKNDSSSNASAVRVAQSKMQRSILKQLESSEGYIAEKNIKYSKSEDLFDDSKLLSREQRALRVSIFPA